MGFTSALDGQFDTHSAVADCPQIHDQHLGRIASAQLNDLFTKSRHANLDAHGFTRVQGTAVFVEQTAKYEASRLAKGTLTQHPLVACFDRFRGRLGGL